MISRVTLFSLLLGLMLAFGIWMGTGSQHDACSAYLTGNRSAQSTEYVPSGTRLIAVPCSDWFMRQPSKVQILCMIDLCLAVVFLLNAVGDLRDSLAARKRMRKIL
jgi:hypothetical protein